MVKFGCCLPGGSFTPPSASHSPESDVAQIVAKCRFLLDCGFDFTEYTAIGLANLSDEDFQQLIAENQQESLGLLAVNSLFPSTYCLANPGDQWEDIITYMHKVIDRLDSLSIPYAVFGSGRARAIPETISKEEGLKNLRKLMCAFADYAEPKGITLVIEPLRSQESNVYNLVSEVNQEVLLINRPGVQLLADSFHMLSEDSPAEIPEDCANTLKHCHIAEGLERLLPGYFNTGDPEYNKRFASSLNRIGYCNGVSIESSHKDFIEEVPKALAYLRSIF